VGFAVVLFRWGECSWAGVYCAREKAAVLSALNESALGGSGGRWGVAWSLPLPVTEDTALHVSSTTVRGGVAKLGCTQG
jgi:hypothetical protein